MANSWTLHVTCQECWLIIIHGHVTVINFLVSHNVTVYKVYSWSGCMRPCKYFQLSLPNMICIKYLISCQHPTHAIFFVVVISQGDPTYSIWFKGTKVQWVPPLNLNYCTLYVFISNPFLLNGTPLWNYDIQILNEVNNLTLYVLSVYVFSLYVLCSLFAQLYYVTYHCSCIFIITENVSVVWKSSCFILFTYRLLVEMSLQQTSLFASKIFLSCHGL